MYKFVAVCLFSVIAVASAAYAPDLIQSLPSAPPLPSQQYAGYIDIDGGRKAFYWFTASQRNPAKDPLVVWLNGGPGCSSLEGNLVELGPITFAANGSLTINTHSWNTVANTVFIESPPGVGFSKDNPTTPSTYTDDLTAHLNYQTLQGFLQKFPEYVGNDLYLTGESYAGHYIPQLANQVYLGNATIRSMMRGFMVGNPCTGDIGCGNADPTLDPYLRYHGFSPLNASIPVADQGNYDPYDILVDTCPNQQLAEHIRFPHPVIDALKRRIARNKLGDVPKTAACSDNLLQTYLNRADVQAAIHAQSTSWIGCGGVNYNANSNGVTDLYKTFMDNTNWKILVFGGTADTVVNFAQTQSIIDGLGRPRLSPWTPWYYPSDIDGQQLAGFYVQYDRVSFATVNGAGHMVPQFQPAPALQLFKTFVASGHPTST